MEAGENTLENVVSSSFAPPPMGCELVRLLRANRSRVPPSCPPVHGPMTFTSNSSVIVPAGWLPRSSEITSLPSDGLPPPPVPPAIALTCTFASAHDSS